MNIFPELTLSWGRVQVELDLCSYATKANLKNATDFDTSKFAKKVDLTNLKIDLGKLDIDKLENVPSNLKLWKVK